MPKPTEELVKELADDPSAALELLPVVYGELRRLAAGFMGRERPDHTLEPTALVHEAFFKLVGRSDDMTFNDRAHFFGVAARAMRQVLVDHARGRGAKKRDAGGVRVTLDRALATDGIDASDLLDLHEALERLNAKEERLARVVELRYFGGLTIRETAAVLGVSHTTVEDDWSLARAWLVRELNRNAA